MTVYSVPVLPQHRFYTEDNNKQFMVIELPSVESLNGVDLDIGRTEIRLLLPGMQEHFSIPLQANAALDAPTAKFSRKRRELTITWDIQEAPVACIPEDTSKCCSEETSRFVVKEQPRDIDCLDLLQDEVEHVLKKCTVDKLKSIAPLGGCSVLLSNFSTKGAASIREKTCNFKVSVSFEWEILDAFGGYLGSSGRGEVLNLTIGDPPKVMIKSAAGGGAQAKKAGEWMKRHGASVIAECLNADDIGAAVRSAWEENAAETKAELPNLDIDWAASWFQQKLSSLSVNLFGGLASANFTKPCVSGNLSVDVLQGAPAAIFNLRISCEWLVAASTGRAEGSLVVQDFASGQDIDNVSLQIETSPGKKSSGQLVTGFRQQGVSAFRGLLRQFAKELQTQLGCPTSTA
jgi:hypothetical protein